MAPDVPWPSLPCWAGPRCCSRHQAFLTPGLVLAGTLHNPLPFLLLLLRTYGLLACSHQALCSPFSPSNQLISQDCFLMKKPQIRPRVWSVTYSDKARAEHRLVHAEYAVDVQSVIMKRNPGGALSSRHCPTVLASLCRIMIAPKPVPEHPLLCLGDSWDPVFRMGAG